MANLEAKIKVYIAPYANPMLVPGTLTFGPNVKDIKIKFENEVLGRELNYLLTEKNAPISVIISYECNSAIFEETNHDHI